MQYGWESWGGAPQRQKSVVVQSLYVLFMNFLRQPYGFSDVMAI
jgi:hypothetical protein